MVTRRGTAAVIVIDAAQFKQLTQRQGDDDLVSFFKNSPLRDLDPDWVRREDDSSSCRSAARAAGERQHGERPVAGSGNR